MHIFFNYNSSTNYISYTWYIFPIWRMRRRRMPAPMRSPCRVHTIEVLYSLQTWINVDIILNLTVVAFKTKQNMHDVDIFLHNCSCFPRILSRHVCRGVGRPKAMGLGSGLLRKRSRDKRGYLRGPRWWPSRSCAPFTYQIRNKKDERAMLRYRSRSRASRAYRSCT